MFPICAGSFKLRIKNLLHPTSNGFYVQILLVDVFIINPLEVGCRRFFIRNLNEPAQIGNIGYGFDNNYRNVAKTMFFRDLFTVLWSLLFIIPGIVKAYEYMMIPYLLADNPQMTKEQAFAESKRMMQGQKWKAFVLDLSFIGWYILSGLTLGILAIFYVSPYVNATHAALYEALCYANPAGSNGFTQRNALLFFSRRKELETMIYHCEDHTCNYWDEGEKLPERCPQCGRKLLRANEADMTGDDWTALGNTLWDAEVFRHIP